MIPVAGSPEGEIQVARHYKGSTLMDNGVRIRATTTAFIAQEICNS